MEDNQELVLDTEKTEQPVEEVVEEVVKDTTPVVEETRKYTDEDVDNIIKRKRERYEKQIRKEYERKYGELEDILTSGLDVDSLEDAKNQLKEFYSSKGKYTPKVKDYDDYDLDILASAEADSIIKSGFEDVVEEVDRLAQIGFENMTARDKKTFTKLAEYRRNEEARQELAKMGVDDEILNDKDYLEFTSKLNPELSTKEKYEIYRQIKPMPEVEPIGSMKGVTSNDNKVKDFYTYEEASKFTRKELDANPELFKAIENSMYQWNK